jgi:peptide/nickel transport system ATP-binding protein
MSAETMLSVEGLTVGFGRPAPALDALAFELHAGEVLGLVGESGSGKSVAGLACLGLCRQPGRIAGGAVVFRGRDLLRMPAEEQSRIRGGQIALVPPNARGALHPMMTLGDQIAGVYRTHRGGSKNAARERGLAMLEAVGIPDPARRLDAFPHELSGGMAQRVAVAMALVCDPQVVIADEPTTGLDVTIQRQVLDLMAALVRERGTAMLMMTRDLGIIAHYSHRVLVLHEGRGVEMSETGAFFRGPEHAHSQRLLAASRERPVPTVTGGAA